jgi:hypothetical protein
LPAAGTLEGLNDLRRHVTFVVLRKNLARRKDAARCQGAQSDDAATLVEKSRQHAIVADRNGSLAVGHDEIHIRAGSVVEALCLNKAADTKCDAGRDVPGDDIARTVKVQDIVLQSVDDERGRASASNNQCDCKGKPSLFFSIQRPSSIGETIVGAIAPSNVVRVRPREQVVHRVHEYFQGQSMKFVIRMAALVFAFLACACLPVTTKTPVGSTVGFRPDSALFGVWRGQDKTNGAPAYFTFVKGADGGMSAITVSPAGKDSDGDWEVYDAAAATLGANRFLSVRPRFANGRSADDWPKGETTPVLYRIVGPTLTLFLLDDALTAAAVKAGKIKGTVESDMRDAHGKVTIRGDVHLTADGAALDACMRTQACLALFGPPLITLRKVE